MVFCLVLRKRQTVKRMERIRVVYEKDKQGKLIQCQKVSNCIVLILKSCEIFVQYGGAIGICDLYWKLIA